MNICIVTPLYKVDNKTNSGIANHYYELAQGLKELGHRVHVVFPSEQKYTSQLVETDNNGSIYFHPFEAKLPTWLNRIVKNNWAHYNLVSKLFTSLCLRKKLHQIINAHSIEIIETTSYNFLCLGYAWLPHRIPLVTRVSTTQHQINRDHYSMVSRAMDWVGQLERMLICRSDYLTTHASAHLDNVCEDFKLSPAQFEIIPHGIKLPDREMLVAEQLCEHLTILFVGRYESRKGIDVLLGAIPKVLQHFPKVRFVLVGNDPQNQYENAFKAEWENQYDIQVEFLGHVDTPRLKELYQTCDVFVAPSRYESFGLVYVEAMAYGKPVIGCNVGGVPEVIKDGITGLLARSGDQDDLAEKILKLLLNPLSGIHSHLMPYYVII